MKYYLCLFIFAISALFGITIKDKFERAEAGAYIVTEQNQLVTLLHLHSKKGPRLLFEEVSIPLSQAKEIEWNTWLQKGAPGHSSWILYEIDLEKRAVTECYSLTRKAWIPTEEMGAFLLPLISLELHELSQEQRLQKGATPTAGNVSDRPWGPPQVIKGKRIQNPDYNVFTAKWPNDSSELSGKELVLYFDHLCETFPFPYWLQVREGALKFKMRAIDSGTGLISPTQAIPRRLPIFNRLIEHEQGKLKLTLKVLYPLASLKLYAVDLSASPRITHLVPFSEEHSGETLTLKLDEDKIRSLFIPGHDYLWLISSDDLDQAVESPHLFKYQPTRK